MSPAALTALAAASAALAAAPLALFLRNLRIYRPPPAAPGGPGSAGAALAAGGSGAPAISVLIPARNEEASIGGALDSVLADRAVGEVLVLDDGSADRTAAIVEQAAARDPRVSLLRAPPLPPGWCGKQHACAALGAAARGSTLIFIDADVRLAPDGAARVATFLGASGADLASGFPREETGSFLEDLLIPLVHFLLLGFLPLDRGRRRSPAFAAGCGQLIAVRREAYRRAGGHGAIRGSLHDGLQLPRAFRRAGLRTDLFDATAVASCRMYRGAGETWRGLGKNAVEGLAAPGTIGPATALLLGGQVLPWILLAAAPALPAAAVALAAAGAAASLLPRLVAAVRFRQPWRGALLHPLGIAVLLAIQWLALARHLRGRPSVWKGRGYDAAGRGRPVAGAPGAGLANPS